MVLECAVLLECRYEYYTADPLNTLFQAIPMRSRVLLSDMNGQTFYTIHHLNHPRSDGIC